MRSLIFCIWSLCVWACSPAAEQPADKASASDVAQAPVDSLEAVCRKAGLVNVSTRLPGVLIDLKYATADNFLHRNVYGHFQTAWLQPDVMLMLEEAAQSLEQSHSHLTFIIYDATRPLRVQEYMWQVLDMPIAEKGKYLSNPANGSVHNYGAAVDISLARKSDSVALDMGTPFDYFGPLAEPQLEAQMLREGKLSAQQVANRKILRKVMEDAGFRQLPTEWWHYNACSREEAKKRYQVIY